MCHSHERLALFDLRWCSGGLGDGQSRFTRLRRHVRRWVGYRSVAGRHSDASSSRQLPDTSTTRRCARVAPQDATTTGGRRIWDCAIWSSPTAGLSRREFQRSCGMNGRSEEMSAPVAQCEGHGFGV